MLCIHKINLKKLKKVNTLVNEKYFEFAKMMNRTRAIWIRGDIQFPLSKFKTFKGKLFFYSPVICRKKKNHKYQ